MRASARPNRADTNSRVAAITPIAAWTSQQGPTKNRRRIARRQRNTAAKPAIVGLRSPTVSRGTKTFETRLTRPPAARERARARFMAAAAATRMRTLEHDDTD